MSHYSEWKRGDILRVVESDYGDPVIEGALVTHDDDDGDITPYCLTEYGALWSFVASRQLEFVSRPEVSA